jgi:hypothetical protein
MRKYLFISIIALALPVAVLAQNYFGAGYVHAISPDESESVHFNGLFLGGGTTFRISNSLSFEPAIYYSFLTESGETSGSIWSSSGVSGAMFDYDRIEHKFDIPLNLCLGSEFEPGKRIFVSAGPAVQVGLVSDMKYNVSNSDFGSRESDYEAGGDKRRLNVLAMAGLGVDLQKVRLTLHYSTNLLPYYEGNASKDRRHNISAGIHYLF